MSLGSFEQRKVRFRLRLGSDGWTVGVKKAFSLLEDAPRISLSATANRSVEAATGHHFALLPFFLKEQSLRVGLEMTISVISGYLHKFKNNSLLHLLVNA